MLRLIVPLIVGIVAAVLHFVVVSRKIPEEKFVRVTKAVRAGQKISPEALESFTIMVAGEEDLAQIKKSILPWKYKASAFNVTAPRDFNAGDPVLWRDAQASQAGLNENALPISLMSTTVPLELLRVGQEVMFNVKTDAFISTNPALSRPATFESIGPFRLLSIDDEVEIKFEKDQTTTRTRDRTVCVAVTTDKEGQFVDPKVKKLLETQSVTMQTGQPKIINVTILKGTKSIDVKLPEELTTPKKK
jgi:hypothetical protein